MATKKSNKSTKSSTDKPKTTTKTAEKTAEKPVVATTVKTKKHGWASFFAKKYDGQEGIATVFKDRKFYGALIGEIVGTALLTLLLLSLAMMNATYNIAGYAFVLIAVLIGVYAFSGACLNPIITAGMMASRRMSVIRGIMYIIAEIVGAWIGWLLLSGLHAMGGEAAGFDVPEMAPIGDGGFWPVVIIEAIGSLLIGFFFARAQEHKRSAFTFAAIVAGGISLAFLVGYVISAAFFELESNMILNPAVALMMNIFPQSGDSFGQVLGNICQALSAYAIFPMLAGVLGFYLSDFMHTLSSDN